MKDVNEMKENIKKEYPDISELEALKIAVQIRNNIELRYISTKLEELEKTISNLNFNQMNFD